jgi:hypothetical protein
MKRLLVGLLFPILAVTVQVQPASAHAPNCGGIAPLQTACTVRHDPWCSCWFEPEPDVSWGVGFTGHVEAKIIGDYGATKIKFCDVIAGNGTCSIPRDDHLQCCTENWTLVCAASGYGSWSCTHSG